MRSVPGRPLSHAQWRVLIAMVAACPGPGETVTVRRLSDVCSMRPGVVTSVLKALESRGLVVPAEPSAREYRPSFDGRARASQVAAGGAPTSSARPDDRPPSLGVAPHLVLGLPRPPLRER